MVNLLAQFILDDIIDGFKNGKITIESSNNTFNSLFRDLIIDDNNKPELIKIVKDYLKNNPLI